VKKLLLILIPLLFISNAYAWYNDFLYRRCFDIIELAGYNLTDYTYKLTLDTSALVPNKIKLDCSDLIVTDINDNKISRVVFDCGAADTKIYFKINISAFNTATYCLYYGNLLYIERNDYNIFTNFEDFEYTTNLNWTISTCSITDSSKYTGFYSLVCNRNRYAEAYLSGNELNFAVKGSYRVGATTYSSIAWELFTTLFTEGLIRFTATVDNSYLDTVFTRYVVSPEPKVYFYPEEARGLYTVELKSYCFDDYVVNEIISCYGINCTVYKNASHCYYGCYAGKCNESPFERSAKLVLIAVGLLALFYIVWRLTR